MKPFLNLNLLNKSKRYIVAVSFGPDSMALLHLLQQHGFTIDVAHVNYHLRQESNLEQSQLEQYCFQHDIPLHVLNVSIMPKGNLQENARKIRYEFFKQLVLTHQADAVLTAHHQDDDLETAWMQRQRSMLYEYFGIRPIGFWEGIRVYRPLLNVSKEALIHYCHEQHVPYAIDSSNAKLIYERNRTRAQLKFMTAEEKDHQRQVFKKENLQRESVIHSLQPYLPKHAIEIAKYLTWDTLTKFLYWFLVHQTRGIYQPITGAWLTKIDQMLQSKKPNIAIPHAKGWHLEKAYDKLWLIHDQDTKPYRFINPTGTITLPLLTIHPHRLKDIPKSFILRSCQAQDALKIKSYTKPFRRLAIDWKMPLFLRKVWPVFTNPQGDILLLPRYQKNHDKEANNWLEILE